MGSLTPLKTEKSLTHEPLVVNIHLINLSTYECIVFVLLQYDFYLWIGETISDVCVIRRLSVVQV